MGIHLVIERQSCDLVLTSRISRMVHCWMERNDQLNMRFVFINPQGLYSASWQFACGRGGIACGRRQLGDNVMETQSKLELIRNFYECHKVEMDDMPKKNDNDNRKWSLPLNQRCDRIGIYVGNSEKIWIYIRSGHEGKSPTRTKRMVKYSDEIRSRLSDQQPFRDKRAESDGRSIGVQRGWKLEEPNEWPAIIYWIKVQFKRLKEIVVNSE